MLPQAAESIAERAAASPRWRRAFVKLGGVEVLLKILRGGLDADTVCAVMRALAELLKENTAQEVCVSGVNVVWGKVLVVLAAAFVLQGSCQVCVAVCCAHKLLPLLLLQHTNGPSPPGACVRGRCALPCSRPGTP